MTTEKKEQLYIQELTERAEQLDQETRHLARLIVKLGENHYIKQDEEEFLECQRILHAREEATGNPFFAPLVDVFEQLVGEQMGKVLAYITEHATEYPYSTGYERRPFRTSDIHAHAGRVYHKMTALMTMDRLGFSLTDYLTKADYALKNNYQIKAVLPDWIAFELDHQNTEVLEALKEIMYGDNQNALLSRDMIMGMLMSHQEDSYPMIGELLTAARLQEGLRQSIVEQMDGGTLEAFRYLLKLIIDQGFIRYSSVVRALGVWTGMGLESANQRVARQLIEQAYDAITNPAIREHWLSSKNANEVYMSLWATAVHEERDLYGRTEQLMEKGELYQKIVAQYVLRNSDNNDIRTRIARLYLDETDEELQHWILQNYTGQYLYEWQVGGGISDRIIKVVRTPLLENKEDRRKDFEQFQTMFEGMKKGEHTENSKVLDFVQVDARSDNPVQKMLYLAAYDMDSEWIAEVIALKDQITPNLRGELLNHFVQDPDHPVQRAFIFACLSDKSMSIREFAIAKAKKLSLSDDEMHQLEVLLKLKTGSVRQSVIGVLLEQSEGQLANSLDRLLQAKSELQRLGGLETLTKIYEDSGRAEQYESLRALAEVIQEPTPKEQQLLDKLGKENGHSFANGFGLYDPDHTEAWLLEQPDLQGFTCKDLFTLPLEEIKRFLSGLDRLVHQYRDVEYTAEFYSGYKETLLIGTGLRRIRPLDMNSAAETGSELEIYPLSEVWQQYLAESGIGAMELLQLVFCNRLEPLDRSLDQYYRYFSDYMDYGKLRETQLLEGWRKEFAEQLYPISYIQDVQQALQELQYRDQVRLLIEAYFGDSAKEETFDQINRALNAVLQAVPESKLDEESAMLGLMSDPWVMLHRGRIYDEESFKKFFHTSYTYEHKSRNKRYFYALNLEESFKAYDAGLIGIEELYKELLSGRNNRDHMNTLTNSRQTWIEQQQKFLDIRNTVIDRILEVELARGDLPTEVTRLTMGLNRIEGMDYFVRILTGLDKETFVRGYVYGYGGSITKKESFSHLLKSCHPRHGEDEALLRDKLKGVNLTEKRLLEAAMYAPQWINLVAGYLGWEGLRSAAWYFHAHMNESFSAEKETIVAHYSPISAQDFNDGAFDISWFQDAYQTLGEERFHLLYDCAKYISAGANHRRSQLFADATLGKLSLGEMKESVADKRNKDHLLSYSLIPLAMSREQDLRERYDFIQQFLTQSKKFGAQRKASEGLASRIALGNLARNAGYADITRLVWDMEARKLDDIQSCFEPHHVDEDTTVQLVIDEEGSADMLVVSKGKTLKSVPSRLKKDGYIAELKELKSELTDQYRRARQELERSMESGSVFTRQELTDLANNPVLSPLVRSLVFKADNQLGYFSPDQALLTDPAGNQHALQDGELLVIAHPLHLYESGQWSEYQRDLFNRQVRQPFKQIFRELYLPNADELAQATVSRRYAGHQIQPKKTVALLKGRHWTVSYEDGLQKVYYAENLIANLYAMADWFSPADTEAPTLETVQFFDRTTYKSVALDQVPPVLFSEVMRDVDLVVSVAHVGGVDPEASLTTIDMRSVIVNESLRLLKIGNVRVDGNYARIEGKLGEYAVHLGSGMAYKQATGALHIIPVHSQHRGRIFLPFLDEDPRTAEILSKVVMLAEDHNIKDPQILEQLQA